MQSTIKKIIALILCGTLLVGVSFAITDQPNTTGQTEQQSKLPFLEKSNTVLDKGQGNLPVEKQETVFVNLNPDGSIRQVIDSNWLKNSRGNNEVVDKTALSKISPVSIAEYNQANGGQITWQPNGEDVYYQGETDKKLPVDVKIDYQLDGKPISADQLAGKSGHVKITVSFENHSKSQYEINGKMETLATPFTTVAMLGLPNDVFSNIELENGKIFSDGNNQIATFIGFPSLSDTLRLKDPALSNMVSIDLPDQFVITADAVDFDLATIAIAMTPEIPDMLKDITNEEDIDQDLADVTVLLAAKETIEQVDPTERIKDLVRDAKRTDQAQLLLNDLFTFYDLETSIIEELPAYINNANIKLFDRVKKDLEDHHFEAVLDNEVIKTLPDRMTAENIEKARKMIARYDEIQTFDIDRLDSMNGLIDNREDLREIFDQAEDILDDVKAHDDEIETLETLALYSDQIAELAKNMEDSGLDGQLTESDMACMLEALAAKKAGEAMQQLNALVPADGSLTPKAQHVLTGMVDQAIAAGQINATSGGAIKVVISGGQLPPQVRGMLVGMAQGNVQKQAQQQLASAAGNLKNLINDAKRIESEIEDDLGSDYKDKITDAVDYADDLKDKMDALREREEKSHDQIEEARQAMNNEADIEYFLEWKDKLHDMKKDLDDNAENVEIAKDLLAQYDKPEIKDFYDNMSIIIDDMEDVRPIAKSFKTLIEKPVYDRQWHNMPSTLNTLINIKDHLDNNRYLADTLKLSLDDSVIEAMRNVLDVVDKKENENRLADIQSDLEQLKALDDRKAALEKMSEAYTSFAGGASDMDSQVRFVLKTDPIEKPEVEKVYQPPVEEKPSFLKWVGSLFN